MTLVFRPYAPPPVEQTTEAFDYEEYDDIDDFEDSDDDVESTAGGNNRVHRRPTKTSGGASLFSRLANSASANITDFIAGAHLPSEEPGQTFTIVLYDSRPIWAQSITFNINFGKRQDASKFASLKKFVTYPVTPTSTNRSVLRRYKHFDWLVHRLHELYPAIAVPSLPDAKVTGHDDAFIQDRETKLLEWANRMSTHPVISQTEVFQHFVTTSEKDEKRWKLGKRKAEKDPFKDIVSYLVFTGDAAQIGVVNSKRIVPALDAYTKYSCEIEKHSKHAMNAAKSLSTANRGPVKSSYQSLGKAVSSLGSNFKKGLSGNYTDLIYFPDMSAMGNAFESIGATFTRISEMVERQPEKDIDVIENATWIQTGTLEHIPG